jgi:hypothetical protein
VFGQLHTPPERQQRLLDGVVPNVQRSPRPQTTTTQPAPVRQDRLDPGVEPLGPNQPLLATCTRAVATDPASRQRFRRYWAPMSAGILLIRYAGLPRMRKEAERRATHAGRPPTVSRS